MSCWTNRSDANKDIYKSARWSRIIAILASTILLTAAPVDVRADFYVQTFDGSNLYLTNPDTGAANLIGDMGVNNVTDLALTSTGNLYAITFTNLYSVNSGTGAATIIGPMSGTSSMVGLDIGPNGLLYGIEQVGGRVFSINPVNGSATLLFQTPFDYVGDLAYYGGDTFYAAAYPFIGSHLVKIDIGTNTAVDVGLIAAGETIPGLDFDLSGRLIAFAQSGNAYSIPNFSTAGAGVVLSNNGVSMAGATTLPVPEPSTLTLALVGMIAAIATGRPVARSQDQGERTAAQFKP